MKHQHKHTEAFSNGAVTRIQRVQPHWKGLEMSSEFPTVETQANQTHSQCKLVLLWPVPADPFREKDAQRNRTYRPATKLGRGPTKPIYLWERDWACRKGQQISCGFSAFLSLPSDFVGRGLRTDSLLPSLTTTRRWLFTHPSNFTSMRSSTLVSLYEQIPVPQKHLPYLLPPPKASQQRGGGGSRERQPS